MTVRAMVAGHDEETCKIAYCLQRRRQLPSGLMAQRPIKLGNESARISCASSWRKEIALEWDVLVKCGFGKIGKISVVVECAHDLFVECVRWRAYYEKLGLEQYRRMCWISSGGIAASEESCRWGVVMRC